MRSNRNLRVIMLAAVALITMPAVVQAKSVKVTVYKDLEAGSVRVETISKQSGMVTIEVLPEDLTPAEIEVEPTLGHRIKYTRTEIADETGKAEFVFSLEPGSYTLYAASCESDELYSDKFNFTNLNLYESLIKELRTKDRSEFVSAVSVGENKMTLGFDIDIYSEKAVGRFFDEFRRKIQMFT